MRLKIQKIMRNVLQFRRMASSDSSCATDFCEECLAPHLNHVMPAVQNNQPIIFLLPAFPAKSPNLAKVLGVLPDMAERLALEFLDSLCKQIQKIYSPGAQVILCADGRVFNDVVGIRDIDVTDYQQALAVMIEDLPSLSIFNLDDLHTSNDFQFMRQQLMQKYGECLTILKKAVREGAKTPCSKEEEEINRQYCGITRFLVEDATHPNEVRSRTAIQKDCRERAYVVIQRSRAWSELIAAHFPHAVRLSIHPQSCGSAKLGIRLMEAESWMTPWHGVAVNIAGRFVLLKRANAEQLGARLVCEEGKHSYYEVNAKYDNVILKRDYHAA